MAAARVLVISGEESQHRAREVEHALASVRIEGHEPDQEVVALYRKYVEGALTSAELDEALHCFFDTEYGPVPLPGN